LLLLAITLTFFAPLSDFVNRFTFGNALLQISG